MKGESRIRFFGFLLVLLLFILITPVSAVTLNTWNSHYSAKITNNNEIVFLEDGQEQWTQKIYHQIGSMGISPNGEYVAVGCEDGVIYLFNSDWAVSLLWQKKFGDSSFQSISFQENGNFIEATNKLNQKFVITRTGNLVSSSHPIPSAVTSSSSPKSSASITNDDSNGFWGIPWYVWGFLALICLWILWTGKSKKRTKSTTGSYQPPPQNGAIYVDSIPNGAEIYFDGIYAGVSPLTISSVIPAIHTIKATLNGYHPETQRINISAGQVSGYSLNLRKVTSPPPKQPPRPTPPQPSQPQVFPPKSFQGLIAQLGAKAQHDREEAQKQLIIKVNTEGKPAIQQIIKELEMQPSGVKREIVNLLYYLSKESHDGQKVTEELILALTYSSSEVKWLIVQTLGRLKDKRALSAIEAATLDTDFLVKYWAIISLKNIQES
jgi:hypothetical protein